MPTARGPQPGEPLIAGVWVDPPTGQIVVKHVNGATVELRCTETGITAWAGSQVWGDQVYPSAHSGGT